jgi:hypothetical protein
MKRCLDPDSPFYDPEFYDWQVMEYIGDHIDELPDADLAKAAKALGVTEDQIIEEPTILTESKYFERNSERFENIYRDAHGMERPVDLRHYFNKLNLEEAPF